MNVKCKQVMNLCVLVSNATMCAYSCMNACMCVCVVWCVRACFRTYTCASMCVRVYICVRVHECMYAVYVKHLMTGVPNND